MTSGPWRRVAVVAPLHQGDLVDVMRTRVVDDGLRRRLGDVVVEWWSSVDTDVDARRGAPAGSRWPHAGGLVTAPAPDAVVVAADGVVVPSGVATVDTTLWRDQTTDPAAAFVDVLEPVALDVRERMLRHLGVLPAGPYVVDRSPFALRRPDGAPLDPVDGFDPSATDLYLLARGAASLDDAALAVVAAADPATRDAVGRELDRLAAAIAEVAPTTGSSPAAGRLTALEAALAAARADLERLREVRRDERRRTTSWMDAAVERERRLAEQLAQAELQAELLAVDPRRAGGRQR